jgi:hypothetical protein
MLKLIVFFQVLFFMYYSNAEIPSVSAPADSSVTKFTEFNNGYFSVRLPSKFFDGTVIKDSTDFMLNLTGKQFIKFFNGGPVELYLTVKNYESKSQKDGIDKIIAGYNKLPDEFFYNPENDKSNNRKDPPEFWFKQYYEPKIESKTCSSGKTNFSIIRSKNFEKGVRFYHSRYDIVCYSKTKGKTALLSILLKHNDRTFRVEETFKTEQFIQSITSEFCPVN